MRADDYAGVSKYAIVETETVSNPAFGVVGGYKVKLVVFAVNHANRKLEHGELSEDPIITTPNTPKLWSENYPRSARQQIKYATSIVKNFLE